MIENITERKQAEEALRESLVFSERLIQSMPDGFSVIDPQGRHTQVNNALCRMTGFSQDELLGVGPPHPYWAPEAYPVIEQAFQETLTGKFADVELSFMRKDGELFPAGRVTGCSSFTMGCSDVKEAAFCRSRA